MSMLAERRRKQKWAVDPRNTAWSNDDSKFGQRMLEKMGWSKGKGLGAQEQGATEHIKVQVKNNHLGLGATINNEPPDSGRKSGELLQDNWIAHQDDFNQLLADLNTCHGQETADSSDNREKRSFSLEKKSRISKNRVHYMKFTKGKDLSSRSKVDLDCVFGKRQSKKTPQDDPSPTTPDENEASATTTSAFTIQEYFAKRMAELKNRPKVTENQIEWKKGKKRNKEKKDKNLENYTQPKTKKPKKEKFQEKEEESPECAAMKRRARGEQQLRDRGCRENSGAPAEDREGCVCPLGDQDLTAKSRERKGKKNLNKQREAALATMLDETPVKKKKKKKKGSK